MKGEISLPFSRLQLRSTWLIYRQGFKARLRLGSFLKVHQKALFIGILTHLFGWNTIIKNMVNEVSKLNSTEDLQKQIEKAKAASFQMSVASETDKNNALELIARELLESTGEILEANKKDLEEGRKADLSSSLMDRLTLDASRITAMASGLRKVVSLKDPVGKVVDGWMHPRGMQITKVTVPLGVIGIIYEARPNVTTDAISLCLKLSNT